MIRSDTGDSRLLMLGEIFSWPPTRKGHIPNEATHGVRSKLKPCTTFVKPGGAIVREMSQCHGEGTKGPQA